MSVLAALAVLAGCSSTNKATPPPSGAFSDSNLKGTYVFSFSGTDVTVTPTTFFTVVGSFAADGNGNITAGTVDIVDPAYGVLQGESIATGSRYAVGKDGRGSGVLNTAAASTAFSSIGIDFVLASSSHGLITLFDGNGTGSGTIDLEDGTVTQSSLGSYVFGLTGVDSVGDPFATAGALGLNGTTTIQAGGLQDINDNGNPSTALTLTGSVTIGASGAPGTAQLTTNSAYNTLQFDVWTIDATHLKLIETDGFALLSGDALSQQTSIAAGQLVYTMAGFDASSSSVLAVGGFLAYNGTSAINGGGASYEDINDGGGLGNSITVAGALQSTGGGRYQLTLSNFFNNSVGAGTYLFAAYPSTTGILLMEIDNGGVTAGTAFPQTATTFASTQGYGLNLTGQNGGNGSGAVEVDDIAEFIANSGGTLSNGFIDENDGGSLGGFQSGLNLGSGGTYTFDASGSGRGELDYPVTGTLIGTLNLDFYVANNGTVLFIDADSGLQTGVGSFQLQNSADPAIAVAHTANHFSMLRAVAARRAQRKK
jgi:hypothetical protein